MGKKKKSFAKSHPLFFLIGLPFYALYRLTKFIVNFVREKPIEKMTGYDYEKFVAKKLLKDGFRKTKLTPQSGDFGADILGVDRKRKRVAVQCKKYAGTVGVKSVQEVIAAVQYYECDYGMVVTNSTFTAAAKELAKKTEVVLKEKYR